MARKRDRSKKNALLFTAFVLVAAVGAGAAISMRDRPRARIALTRPRSNPSADPLPESDIVVVEDGQLVVAKLDAFRAHANMMIEDAQRIGIAGPSNVLAYMMRRLAPRHAWPPSPDSALWSQWRDMVSDLAETLYPAPQPDSRPILHRVK